MQQPKKTFEQVLEDNKNKIYRICRIYAIAPVEPQDLFQEVVYHAWKSFPGFKGQSGEGTWLYKIALNVCLRAKMKLEKVDSKNVRLESIQFMPVQSGPDEVREERYQALRDCIASLNESDQSLVILYLEELPYKEIAQVTGLTENHVAVKMKRIRKMLFDCITPKLG
ncbi:MAG: sigma-70 family RNA polymerase sigma factor [Roseivirga sp.]|nr:sigma-70 family RNA polymerase sigma factor [Roseivirga sp.]